MGVPAFNNFGMCLLQLRAGEADCQRDQYIVYWECVYKTHCGLRRGAQRQKALKSLKWVKIQLKYSKIYTFTLEMYENYIRLIQKYVKM